MRDTTSTIKDKRQSQFEREKTKNKLPTRRRTQTNAYYADVRSQSFSMAETHPFAAAVFVMISVRSLILGVDHAVSTFTSDEKISLVVTNLLDLQLLETSTTEDNVD
jgi:hypothetical protein